MVRREPALAFPPSLLSLSLSFILLPFLSIAFPWHFLGCCWLTEEDSIKEYNRLREQEMAAFVRQWFDNHWNSFKFTSLEVFPLLPLVFPFFLPSCLTGRQAATHCLRISLFFSHPRNCTSTFSLFSSSFFFLPFCSLRLPVPQLVFMKELARPPGMSMGEIKERYDRTWGVIPPSLMEHIKERCRKALKMSRLAHSFYLSPSSACLCLVQLPLSSNHWHLLSLSISLCVCVCV